MIMATFFGGGLGKAEKAIKGRDEQLKEQEAKAMGVSYDKKKNEDAANGKTRLTTDDKKYK